MFCFYSIEIENDFIFFYGEQFRIAKRNVPLQQLIGIHFIVIVSFFLEVLLSFLSAGLVMHFLFYFLDIFKNFRARLQLFEL